MQLIQNSPTSLRLVVDSSKERLLLEKVLTYHDNAAKFEWQNFKYRGSWYARKNGEEAYKERLQQLKEACTKSLLFSDEQGDWTYSGLVSKLKDSFSATHFNEVTYPSSKLIAYDHIPKYPPRNYQKEAAEALLAVRHGGVEIGTGLGKSYIIRMLLAELGLQAVVMAPSRNIAKQLYKDFVYHFGKKNVGFVGDGKKEFGKLFTVGISASLTKLSPGDAGYTYLQRSQIFIADESHQCPASTLASVCFGLMKDVPYRFFFSGTQLRQDGLDLLLDAITGDIVYRMTVQDGVDQGYLAKPIVRMIQMASKSDYRSDDANEMTRAHLYYNPAVNALAGQIANQMVEAGRQTVILVDEVEQVSHLMPQLAHPFKFAHGGLTKENAGKVPKQFYDSDPDQFVDEFNAGEYPILIGTSCISTGTDLQPVGAIINLVGGKSEIQLKQGPIGRGTRGGFSDECHVFHRMEGPLKGQKKTDFFVFDFDVQLPQDNPKVARALGVEPDEKRWSSVHRHSMERASLYQSVYPSFELVEL